MGVGRLYHVEACLKESDIVCAMVDAGASVWEERDVVRGSSTALWFEVIEWWPLSLARLMRRARGALLPGRQAVGKRGFADARPLQWAAPPAIARGGTVDTSSSSTRRRTFIHVHHLPLSRGWTLPRTFLQAPGFFPTVSRLRHTRSAQVATCASSPPTLSHHRLSHLHPLLPAGAYSSSPWSLAREPAKMSAR